MISFIILGLFVSGVTAFPLESELHWISKWFVASDSLIANWLWKVYHALVTANRNAPFLAYGTDWLAFAHIVLAILFVGPFVHPVRNKWVLQFGLIACAGVIPLALIAGHIREIPLFWQLIDCSFGVLGSIPLVMALHWVQQLEKQIINPI